MSAILPLLLKFGPWLLALAGIVFGAFRHQQAKTITAQAGQKVAEAQQQVSAEQAAEARANADAQKSGSDAAAARSGIENQLAAQPADEVRNELQDWTRR